MTLTNIKMDPFLPEKVIRVYKRRFNSEYYIEIADVITEIGSEEAILGPSRPLSKNTLRRIAGVVNEKETDRFSDKIMLDPGLLAFSPHYHERFILWYRQQEKRTLIFQKKELTLWMPAMIYLVVFDKLYVFAVKSNVRPHMQSKLYIAPIMNLSGPYNICWGSVKTAHKIYHIDKEITFWEGKLWNSVFAHVGHRCSKSEIMSVYNKCATTGAKFPKSELVSLHMTLYDALKKHLP